MKIRDNDPRLKGVTKERLAVRKIKRYIEDYPIVILSGPRKVGKTTALLQLAIENENSEYIDCNNSNAVELVQHFLDNVEDVLLIIDEIQKIKNCQDWLTNLSVKADHVPTFRVIITGSVTALTDLLAHYKGGGRNKLIRMPIITYLEYLYLTSRIESYDIDLYAHDYGDSFLDFMKLKGLTNLNIGPIDRTYFENTCTDIEEARENVGLSTALLDETVDDISRAYILLAYRLACDRKYYNIFEKVYAGSFELQIKQSSELSNSGALDSSIIYKAISLIMTHEQIAKALRYLLWHGLAVYNYTAGDVDEKPPVSLMPLYFGREEAFQEQYIKSLFAPGNSIFVVNPLIYSSISDDLCESLKRFIMEKSMTPPNSSGLDELFNLIRQKLSSRPDGFLKDKKILGPWVECYLRGAFAMRGQVSLPLVTRSFRNIENEEVDITGSTSGAMIEVSVMERDKIADDVHFQHFKKGNEPCILVTNKNFGLEEMNGVSVMKIPYPMLAAFLDKGKIPYEEDVRKVLKSRRSSSIESAEWDMFS